ncbi:vanadium-dependent haloperoxidase [Sorangium sp. So ce131]|uniref:vanadium-dependent haloperoxidase n=1 Tax=Sorangium sp. So ce131 TaxID=3133282 RepID=UPI003F5F0D71
MAFPEGSPLHPAYPSGHATVAGATITLLKALFDTNVPFPNPVIPNPSNTSLLGGYGGPTLTVEGELNKLASNIALGRNFAGVHWRSDATEGLKLGEAIAIEYLNEIKFVIQELAFPVLGGGAVVASALDLHPALSVFPIVFWLLAARLFRGKRAPRLGPSPELSPLGALLRGERSEGWVHARVERAAGGALRLRQGGARAELPATPEALGAAGALLPEGRGARLFVYVRAEEHVGGGGSGYRDGAVDAAYSSMQHCLLEHAALPTRACRRFPTRSAVFLKFRLISMTCPPEDHPRTAALIA